MVNRIVVVGRSEPRSGWEIIHLISFLKSVVLPAVLLLFNRGETHIT